MLLDAFLERVLPGTDDSVDLLTVLKEEEGRHRLDIVLRSNILANKETTLAHPPPQRPCGCDLMSYWGTILTFSSSTSTFRKTAPGNFLAYSTNTGAMTRQGPHQEAVKSMIT
jgi:hypothetical protein